VVGTKGEPEWRHFFSTRGSSRERKREGKLVERGGKWGVKNGEKLRGGGRK